MKRAKPQEEGKILVTGGAGFIGSHTLVCLLEAGYSCVSMDNFDNSSLESLERVKELSGRPDLLESVAVDLVDLPQLKLAIESHGPFVACLHFAGFKAVGESTQVPLAYYYNNVVGSLNLLVCCNLFNISKLVFSSSCTVYGSQPSPFSESAQDGHANSPYGRTKVHIEQIIRDAAMANKQFRSIFLRYFNPVGAHESGRLGEDPLGVPNNLFPFVSQVASGKRAKVVVFGSDYDTPDGTGVRDYIHVVDLARAHLLALERILKPNEEQVEVFNVGTGKGSSVLEVIACFEKVCGKKIPVEMAGRRAGDVESAYCNTAKAETVLGFKAVKTLEDACRDGWKWQTMNPSGFNSNAATNRTALVFALMSPTTTKE